MTGGRSHKCPRCGSAEREQHMREVICGSCRVVLEYRNTQPVLVMDLPEESDDASGRTVSSASPPS